MQQHLEHGIRVHDQAEQGAHILLVHEADELMDELVADAHGQDDKEEDGVAYQRDDPHVVCGCLDVEVLVGWDLLGNTLMN